MSKGIFSMTVKAAFPLRFKETVQDIMQPLLRNPDYQEVEWSLDSYDDDTGIAYVDINLCKEEEVTIDKSNCSSSQAYFDSYEGQWYPGSGSYDVKVDYDKEDMIKDLKTTLTEMGAVGSVFVNINSVSTLDYYESFA